MAREGFPEEETFKLRLEREGAKKSKERTRISAILMCPGLRMREVLGVEDSMWASVAGVSGKRGKRVG